MSDDGPIGDGITDDTEAVRRHGVRKQITMTEACAMAKHVLEDAERRRDEERERDAREMQCHECEELRAEVERLQRKILSWKDLAAEVIRDDEGHP